MSHRVSTLHPYNTRQDKVTGPPSPSFPEGDGVGVAPEIPELVSLGRTSKGRDGSRPMFVLPLVDSHKRKTCWLDLVARW